MQRVKVLMLAVSWATSIGPARAQFRGGSDWTTTGGDAHRSSWVRTDAKISVEKIEKGGFGLAWKIKLASEPAQATTLGSYIGYRGFRSYAFVGSASGELTAIDSDLGRVEWQKKIGAVPTGRATGACGGGMTANLARPSTVAFPAAPAGRGGGGGGRGGPARSAAGQPGEGAVTIAAAEAAAETAAGRGRGAPGAPGPNGGRGPGAPGAPGPNGGRGPGRRGEMLSAVASDGTLHNMYVSNGEEPAAPVAFLPANANARQLTVVNNVAYAATSQDCGGVPNGIWALDIASSQVTHWTPVSGDLAGGGFAFGPAPAIYVATTKGDLAALDPRKLEPQGVYRAAGQSFNTSPVVFEYKTKPVIAAASQEGSIHLVDAAAMTGVAYPGTVSGAFASWEDSGGARWLVAPSRNSIAAWKVQGDAPALSAGWTSAEMTSPLAPIVVNGVVFAVGNSPNAVLHALDGANGKEIWNSGKTMTAPVRIGGLSSVGSQVYIGAGDGTIYAFTFPIEH